MKGQLCFLVAALILACGAAAAEDGGPTSGWRKLGPEEVKSVLKDVGLGLRDTPTYPTTAYRLYPEPYKVFELATVGYSPWETLDGSPLNGANPEDTKLWGPDGEPVVILHKQGTDRLWMEGFFSKKRVEVDLDRYTYRYLKVSEENKGREGTEYPQIEFFKRPEDYGFGIAIQTGGIFHLPQWKYESISQTLNKFITPSSRDGDILALAAESPTLPALLGKSYRDGNRLAECEPISMTISRLASKKSETPMWHEERVYWAKALVHYYPPSEKPPGRNPIDWLPQVKATDGCPVPQALVAWPESGRTGPHGDTSEPHLLPDDTILVSLGWDIVLRLRWEDGEPVGPLPPFIKVIDAREVIWAKLDLLRRYRDEMRARGLTDATKLRTPTQIMHDLAAYFFDVREIKNWKGGDK